MWQRCLLKNKFYATAVIFLGALSVPVTRDGTFFLFHLMLGLMLFFSKENLIYGGGGLMGCAEVRRTKKNVPKAKRNESKNGHLQFNKSTVGSRDTGENGG